MIWLHCHYSTDRSEYPSLQMTDVALCLQVPQGEAFEFAPGEHGITDWVGTIHNYCCTPSSFFFLLLPHLLPPILSLPSHLPSPCKFLVIHLPSLFSSLSSFLLPFLLHISPPSPFSIPLPSPPPSPPPPTFLPYPSILISQQTDQLLTSKMVESASMATISLISLVQLLDKVKNMVISDYIQQEVRGHCFVCEYL